MAEFRKIISALLLVGTTSLATAGTVHNYCLTNGLKLIVKEDHRSPVVSSQIWYKVGSSYELAGITGISHALEHMMFRGSQHYGPDALFRLVAENGGVQNAFTTEDFTAYYQEWAANKLALSFALEADRMRYLLLRSQDFTKEMQVVREERRMRIDDNPQAVLQERLTAIALASHPYQHPVIGWPHDLQQMTIADLQRWYQKWYVPNNAILVVVGDVQPKQVYRLAQQYFGPLKPASGLPSKHPDLTPLLKPRSKRQVTVKIPARLPSLIMAYNVPVISTEPKNLDPYALELIAVLLAGGDSARLSRDLIRGQQLATTATVDYNPFSRLPSLWSLYAVPTPGHTVAELQTALQHQIKQLKTTPVRPEELERAKTQILSNRTYQQDSITAQGYEIGRLEAVGLSWRVGEHHLQCIRAISALQIQAVAQRYLTPERLTVANLSPLPISPTHAP